MKRYLRKKSKLNIWFISFVYSNSRSCLLKKKINKKFSYQPISGWLHIYITYMNILIHTNSHNNNQIIIILKDIFQLDSY